MAANPYAAPAAVVEDVRDVSGDQADFNPEGNVVPAGNGLAWIRRAWELYRAQPLTWIGMMVVFMILSAVIQIVPIVGPIVGSILMPVFMGGLMLGCLALDDGDRIGVGNLFDGFRNAFGQLALIGLVQLAVFFAIGIGVALLGLGTAGRGSTVALVVVGLVAIVAMFGVFMAVWFAPALVIINEMSAMEALATSVRVNLRNWSAMLVYGLAILLFAIGVAIVMGVLFGGSLFGMARGGGTAAFAAVGMAIAGAMALMFVVMLVFGPLVVASIYAGYRDIFYED